MTPRSLSLERQIEPEPLLINTMETPKKATTPTPAKTSDTDGEERLMWLIRILYVCYYCSTGSILPYLSVYYRSLGHDGRVIGFLSSLRAFLVVVVGPLWGVLADSQVHNLDTMAILKISILGSITGYCSIGTQTHPTALAVAVFVTACFYAPVKSLLDSMVLSRIKNSDEFGKLRLWGPIGYGLGCFLSGTLATYAPNYGYRILFAFYALLNIPLLATIWVFPPPKNNHPTPQSTATSTTKSTTTPQPSLTKSLLELPTHTWVFLFLVLAMGTNSGAIETFCYVRMEDIGASGQLIGSSRLLSAVAGTPMFWFSGHLSRLIPSEHQILVLCLLAYTLRFAIYALARTPIDALPAEVIRGVYFAAFYSTASKYAHRYSPKGFPSTMLMIVNCLYSGLGQAMGSSLAGMLQNEFGTVQAFLVFSAWNFFFAILMTFYAMAPPRRLRPTNGHAKQKLL